MMLNEGFTSSGAVRISGANIPRTWSVVVPS